jgi:iron(III) transport system ATP-binding protein
MIDIELTQINKSYRQGKQTTAVLQDIDLRIEPSEFFFLLGPSGCGKTTLLRILAGLLEPTSGTIRFGGQDITNLPAEKRKCAMVFQNYALWPHMTVGQNVEFGPSMQGIGAEDRKKIVLDNLKIVRMEEYVKRKSNQLSGGQQQRVALARALAANPQCLLLDEPLSNLDARLRAQMRTEIRDLVKKSDKTAVYVTHDQKEALSMADKIAVLNQGKIVQIGTPQQIYHYPENRFVADFIGDANFISGTVISLNPVKIQTPVGMLITEQKENFSLNQQVTCCIRPEYISISDNKEPDTKNINKVTAHVISSVFLGKNTQIDCKLKNGELWSLSILPDFKANFSNNKIVLNIPPSKIHILKS